MFKVYNRVVELHVDDGVAISHVADIFEETGNEFGIGKTTASKLYYEALNFLDPSRKK